MIKLNFRSESRENTLTLFFYYSEIIKETGAMTYRLLESVNDKTWEIDHGFTKEEIEEQGTITEYFKYDKSNVRLRGQWSVVFANGINTIRLELDIFIGNSYYGGLFTSPYPQNSETNNFVGIDDTPIVDPVKKIIARSGHLNNIVTSFQLDVGQTEPIVRNLNYKVISTPKNVILNNNDNIYVGDTLINNINTTRIPNAVGKNFRRVDIASVNNASIIYEKLFPNGVPLYPTDTDDPEGDNDDPTDPTPSDQDKTSDPVPIPTKPMIDVTNTGFVTLYNPDAIAIRQLAYFMWSGDFTDLLKKMFSAPFDCLIGLKLIYAPITTGASQTIWLGNVESNVSAPKITDQFTDFDCGTITLNGYFGSFLDYAPYTKVTIFLPFIGYKQLNVDEVMDSQIHLTYRIDAYSGACIAFIHVTKTIGSTTLNSVIYEFDGNCAMDIPFTSGDMSRYVAAILGTAASTAGAVVSMGAGAKLATQSTPITANDPWTKADFSNKQTVTGLSDLGNGSAELIGGKPQIQRGGSLAGANASMALKQPYLIIERPMQQMPADYASFIGIPLNMTKTLSQISGFTVVSQVFMASSQATDDELDMINTLLRQGVII